MRTLWIPMLVLALAVGGCAAPDQPLSTPPPEAPTSSTASSVPSSTTSTHTASTATSSTPTTTSPSTTSTTTTSTSPPPALTLRGDGLGIVAFGDPADDVMAILVGLFGPPSYDRLEESPFESEGWSGPDRGPVACHVATVPIFGGYGCFDYIRVTSWSDVGLTVVFSDLMVNPWAKTIDDDYVEVPPGLAGYVYGAGDTVPSARTAQGIGVGSTVRELLTLGEAVTFGFGCGDNVEFSIADPDSANGGVIHGSLFGTDGEAFMESEYGDPKVTIRSFIAGASRSC